jgi:hypothetical protein
MTVIDRIQPGKSNVANPRESETSSEFRPHHFIVHVGKCLVPHFGISFDLMAGQHGPWSSAHLYTGQGLSCFAPE